MRFVQLLCTLLLLAGASCQQAGSVFQRSTLPDLGERLPASTRVEFDPALTSAIARYANACNQPQELRIGQELQAVLLDAAYQTFQTVHPPGRAAPEAPDIETVFTLQQSGLQIQTDNVYDRLPAELTLESVVVFRDRSGNLLGERTLRTKRQQRILVEATQHRCAYVSMDSFLHDAAVTLATQFMREARAVLDPSREAAAGPSPSPSPSPTEPASTQKAAAPSAPAPQAKVSPPVPPSIDTPGHAGPPGPSGTAALPSVDHIPAMAAFSRPGTFLIAVGVNTHRDPTLGVRKYAALDAEQTANYFQTVGGVPASNVRLLVDMKALRPDIEEAVLDWLPSRITPDSVVIIYFSGQAKVTPAGEVFFVPYEGGTTPSRLYSLKDLQVGLSRLKARQILLMFDGTVSRLPSTTPGKVKEPQWDLGGTNVVRLISTSGIREALESEKFRHGLFTYYLLRGLKGEADDDLDGEVTLGEITAFIARTVPSVAKTVFNQEQHPLIIPPIRPGSPPASVPLSKSGR